MLENLTMPSDVETPTLNPEQLAALRDDNQHILVLAGAGTGKTRVLTSRIVHLLHDKGVDPSQILALTFSNRAAREMRERVEMMLRSCDVPEWIGTFHSICARLLRQYAEELGYTQTFAIYDDDDQKQLLKRILKAKNVDESRFPLGMLKYDINIAKNYGDDPEAEETIQLKQEIFKEYAAQLVQNNAMDFGDLLLKAVQLTNQHENILKDLQATWKYILVDEYQDTNRVQRMLLKNLVADDCALFVVGDEDQSIYGWRGAEVENILRFSEDFRDSSLHKLERNYRSTGNILKVANSVISQNVCRNAKELWTDADEGELIEYFPARTEREEAEYVVQKALSLRSQHHIKLSEIALFYRTHAQSRALEEAAIRNGLPYRIFGGLRFYERAEIKDALSYLRLCANPYDVISFRRAVKVPSRGIGDKSIEKLLSFAQESGLSLIDALARVKELSSALEKRFKPFQEVLLQLRELIKQEAPVYQIVDAVIDRAGLITALRQSQTVEAEARIENLYELVAGVRDYCENIPNAKLEDFLQHVSLVADLDMAGGRANRSLDQDLDTVFFMTLHSSKGLEFDYVFLTGLEEGIFPHQRSMDSEDELEEERRLCYVGVTRARRRLWLSSSMSRRLYQSTQYNSPSRFLRNLPADLVRVSEAYGGVVFD